MLRFKKHTILVLIAACMFVGKVNAFQQKLNNLEFQTINVNDGLSFSTVTCVLKDSYGYLWIATLHGLNKYDGSSITTYLHDPDNMRSICGNMITDLLEDREGNIWLGTWQSGVSKYIRDKDYFQSFPYKPEQEGGLNSNAVIQIEEDHFGNLWFATVTAGLTAYYPSDSSFHYFPHDPDDSTSVGSDRITAAYQDKKGNLWLAGFNGTLDVFHIASGRAHSFPLPEYLQAALQGREEVSIYVDDLDTVWLGIGGEGLFTYCPVRNNWKSFSAITNANITDILPHHNSLFFIINTGGLNVYNTKQGTVQYITSNDLDNRSLVDNNISNMYIDEEEVVWIGTAHYGLNYSKSLAHSFFNYYPVTNTNNSISDGIVSGICQTDDGRIFVATKGGGLNEFFEEEGTFQRVYFGNSSHPINADFLTHVYAHENTLYVGSFMEGLCIYNLHNKELRLLGRDISRYRCVQGTEKAILDVRSIFVDSKENIWIGTLNDGVYKFDEVAKSYRHFIHDPDDSKTLNGKRIYDFLEHSSGAIWIATESVGLNKYNVENHTFTRFTADGNARSLSSNSLNSLMEDTEGNIWIGTTGGGVNRLNVTSGDFISYHNESGIFSDVIYDITEDADGVLWMGSADGLFSFNPDKERAFLYDKNDGIVSNQFTLTSCLKAKSGRFYFGTKEGMVGFKPEQVSPDTLIQYLEIVDFRVLNKSIDPGVDTTYTTKHIAQTNQVNLSYKDYVFSIEFAAVDLINPQKVSYKYKMEGFDQHWTETDFKQRSATYTNLPGGEYTFQVMASKQFGIWSEPKKLIVKIAPPYWETMWFRTGVILITAILVYLAFTIRMRILREQKRQLQIKVNKRTAEISKQNQQILEQKNRIEKHKDELEEQVAIRTRDLQVAKERAEEADRLKTSFLSNMSHEIRTPLNAILGFVDVLFDSKTPLSGDQQNHFKNIVQSNGHTLATLIDDIIDIARIESNQINVVSRTFNLVDMLKELEVEYSEKLRIREKDDVTFLLDTGGYQNVFIESDEGRMRQVVVNFLENAIKFTSKGVLTLGIKEEADYLSLFVKDSGIGIDEKYHEFIFDRFTKLESDRKKLYRGTGIGLFISKRIVDLLGYTIHVDSATGRGSEFAIRIPIESITSTQVRQVKFQAEGNHRDWSGKTVLIVEDELVNSQLLEHLLREKHINTITVDNGEDAVNICREREDFDLILMDIKLPRLNGMEATRSIRTFNATIPIIAQTAYAIISEKKEIINSGCNDYLSKPIAKKSLYDMLAKYLIAAG